MLLRRASLPVVAALLVCSCAKDGGSPLSPTAPASSPTLAADPPSVPQLTFYPETTAPSGESVGFALASRAPVAGKITVAVMGYNLKNALPAQPGFPSVWPGGFASIDGRVEWNPDVLDFEGAEPGSFMTQGGVNPFCCSLAYPGIIPTDAHGFTFEVHRGNKSDSDYLTPPPVAGTGELMLLTFRPKAGVRLGETSIVFAPFDPTFYSRILLAPYQPSAVRHWGTPIDHYYSGVIMVGPGSGGGGAR